MDNLTVKKDSFQYSSLFKIEENILLADKNWFQTGGSAKFYGEPKSAQDFAHALDFAKTNNLKIFILGQGANVLISDSGFSGLVIRPMLKDIFIESINELESLVHVGSGVIFHDLILFCLHNNLTNLEEFSGIPGTVGGSVYINLHYYEFLLEHFLIKAQVIEKSTGTILTVDHKWFNFGYDQSKLQDQNYFLISASFKCKKANDYEIARARGRREEIIRHRERRYPQTKTCGSFFRNFLPEEVKNTENKLIYVAYYLDKIGIKGELSVGGAIVSYQHANMIVNCGSATSADIVALAQIMQTEVLKQFGIKPQPECQLIGFDKNPLA